MRLRAFSAVLLLLASACGPGSDVSNGRELYLSYGCAACHGVTGDGSGPAAGLAHVKPRDLRNVDAFRGSRTIEGIASTIAFGVADGRTGMPAYPDIPKSERMAMARYIHSLASAPRGIALSDAWAAESNPAWKIAAAYLTITNRESRPVALTAVSSPDARVVEMHETRTADGMMSMRQVRKIEIGPGSSVALRPGGSHLMLIDLTRDLRAGDSIGVTLTFDDGSVQHAKIPVKNAD